MQISNSAPSLFENETNWLEFSDDLTGAIFGLFLPFKEQSAIACVCKRWQKVVMLNTTGAFQLFQAGLKPSGSSSWMNDFRNTFNIIAIDISASMGYMEKCDLTRKQIAVKKALQIAKQLDFMIETRGITCIAFATKSIAKTVYSVKHLKKIYRKEYTMDKGTNLSRLFKKIKHTLQTLKNQNLSSCRITIISDFDDFSNLDFNTLFSEPTKLKMHFNCIRIGKNTRGDQVQQDFQTFFKKIQEADNQKSIQTTASVLNTNRKRETQKTQKTEEGLPSNKRKNYNSMKTENEELSEHSNEEKMEVELAFSEVDFEELPRPLKKQKREK